MPILVLLLLAFLIPSGLGAQPLPGASSTAAADVQIVWQVRNRFRLFRREADFNRHVQASLGGVLAAEQQLARETDGRGWAKDMVDQLCLDTTGRLTETCQRDGERESYLAPADHRITAQLSGAVQAGAQCTWSFDDGTPPARQISRPCAEPITLRVRYGVATVAAAGITRTDGTVDSVTTEIRVEDLLIAGIGDSIAAGEGNPDRAVALDDSGFCFRRFLGSGLSEYFRPSRAGYKGQRACGDVAIGASTGSSPPQAGNDAADWARHGARWMSAACHASLYGYQMRTALALAVENPQVAVTFLPLACSGATIEAGLFGSQRAAECPLRGTCAASSPPQLATLRSLLDQARKRDADRTLDLLLLTVGANDVKFSALVAEVMISPGVERTLFSQAGLIADAAESRSLLERALPGNFAKLRSALKPLLGGDLSRVVYVSYGHPAMEAGVSCPGTRDGFDVHPSFEADGPRLAQVTAFVLRQFQPRLKALARCEGGVTCREPATDRMTFVDAHQSEFARRGLCVRSPDDPPFDRECFSADGKSFETDPVAGSAGPLTCSLPPSAFRPYAPRARWIRTANDSYFTAMTYPQGLMQPSNIHDATWGALSAVYGGAIHPTAEGHAAMADAALPAVRQVLRLPTPAQVTSAPLAAPQ